MDILQIPCKSARIARHKTPPPSSGQPDKLYAPSYPESQLKAEIAAQIGDVFALIGVPWAGQMTYHFPIEALCRKK
jgi:hypothetical protein